MWKLILCVLSLVVVCLGSDPCCINKDQGMQNPDLFEGDIVMETSNITRRTIAVDREWPNARIPYEISKSFGKHLSLVKLIEGAMRHIEKRTCVRFERRAKYEKNFVYIVKGKGCHSKVGMEGGAQLLSLGSNCHRFGIILHELCHAIGLYHEHTRPDRDNYVTILWDNLEDGSQNQFRVVRPPLMKLIDSFDYKSIMLYGDTAFSADRMTKTMVSKDPWVNLPQVGDKISLSKSDVYRINTLYNCRRVRNN